VAKPGKGAAEFMGALGGAVDLARPSASLDEQRLDHERKAGMRCGGCKRRITLGFEFVVFAEHDVHRGVLVTSRTYACNGANGCAYAAMVAQQANAMRPIEWAYLDEQRGERIVGAADPRMEWKPPATGTVEA
jgi:hypothetical protein